MHGAGGTGAEYTISLCIAPKRRPEAAATATAKVQPGGAGVPRVSPQAGPESATGRALSSMRKVKQWRPAPCAHCRACRRCRSLSAELSVAKFAHTTKAAARSEERRVGKQCVSQCRHRGCRKQ